MLSSYKRGPETKWSECSNVSAKMQVRLVYFCSVQSAVCNLNMPGTFRFTYDGKRIQSDDTPLGVSGCCVHSVFI